MAPSTMRRYIVSHRNGIDGLVLEQDAPVPALNSPTSASFLPLLESARLSFAGAR